MINNTDNQNYIRTTEQYKEQQMKENSEKDALGRDAFLTLFTTQLKNQNPLDPMGNEAFVAQLAQFSQVEGIKGMQGSMEELVSTVKAEQMFAGSNLVGKRVAITGGVVSGGDGAQRGNDRSTWRGKGLPGQFTIKLRIRLFLDLPLVHKLQERFH